MKSKFLPLLLAVFFFSSVSQAGLIDKAIKSRLAGKAEPVGLDQASDPKIIKSHIKSSGLNKIKGVKTVIVPNFTVEFLTYTSATSAVSTGAFSGVTGTTKSKLLVNMKNPDTGAMQKITDELYDDFVKELKDKGFDVVDKKKVAATASYQAAKTRPNMDLAKGSQPGAKKSYYVAPTGLKSYSGGALGGLANAKTDGRIWNELGAPENAAVVHAHYIVTFGNMETYGKRNISSTELFAKVGFNPYVTIMPGSIVSFFANPKGNEKNVGFGTYAQAFATRNILSDMSVVSSFDDVTSAGYKAAAAITAVGSMLSGSADSFSAKELEAIINWPAYISAAPKHSRVFTRMVLSGL